MPAVYEAHGLRFLYPENWQLDEQLGDAVLSISVQSPDTAFWMISLYESQPAATDTAEDHLSPTDLAKRQPQSATDLAEAPSATDVAPRSPDRATPREGQPAATDVPKEQPPATDTAETHRAATDVADEALAALREDYPELDADPARETIAGQPAVGHNISFVSLDFINTCWTRAFRLPNRTVLILSQANDRELPQAQLVLRAISKSLAIQP